MYAFTTPTLPLHRPAPVLSTRTSHDHRRIFPRSTPRWRCQADENETSPALTASQGLRDELDRRAADRQLQADRTEQALADMQHQLAKIMAKLREDAGMPPVAEPPNEPLSSAAVEKATVDGGAVDEEDGGSGGDEPYMDPKNFGYDSTAGWQVLAATDELPVSESGNVEFRIECDMNGCSIIEIRGDAPPGPGVRQKFIRSGPGFRVGYDPEAPKSFCGMVGNEQWLLALNVDEVRHFKRLCLALQKKMDRIGKGEEEPPVKKAAVRRSGDGMFNMRIARAGLDCSVELESKLVWVQAMGQPVLGQYCIRAIFMESRQSEGFWPMDTVPGMLTALNKIAVE